MCVYVCIVCVCADTHTCTSYIYDEHPLAHPNINLYFTTYERMPFRQISISEISLVLIILSFSLSFSSIVAKKVAVEEMNILSSWRRFLKLFHWKTLEHLFCRVHGSVPCWLFAVLLLTQIWPSFNPLKIFSF